ncbi:MAG: hypothetical protein ACK559_02460, partial [bacterium]
MTPELARADRDVVCGGVGGRRRRGAGRLRVHGVSVRDVVLAVAARIRFQAEGVEAHLAPPVRLLAVALGVLGGRVASSARGVLHLVRVAGVFDQVVGDDAVLCFVLDGPE